MMRTAKGIKYTALTLALAMLVIFGSRAMAAPDYPITVKGYSFGEKLTYEIGWKSVTAAKAEIWIEKGTFNGIEALKVKAKARTIGFPRRLWKMDGYAESLMHLKTLKPIKYYMDETENGLRTRMGIDFDHEKKLATSTRKRSGNTRIRKLFGNNMHDPISMVTMMRSIDMKPGEEKVFQLTEGSHKWFVKLRILKREKITVKAGTFTALKIIPSFTELRKKARKKPKEPKLKKAVIWVSDDEHKYPLKLESKVFIGRVYAELVKISK